MQNNFGKKFSMVFLQTIMDHPSNTSTHAAKQCVFEIGQFMTIIILNTLLTLICGGLMVWLIICIVHSKSKRKEVRDKLSEIVHNHYWQNELRIKAAIDTLHVMRQRIIFKDVTALQVFAYKYRLSALNCTLIGVDKSCDNNNSSALQNNVKIIERLFDVLALRLPSTGHCTKAISELFGETIADIALHTVALWGDKRSRTVTSVVRFFAGNSVADNFMACLVSDRYLNFQVTAHLPYVDWLVLADEHFLLNDAHTLLYLKPETCSKLRYIDTVFASNASSLVTCEKVVMQTYCELRKLCIENKASLLCSPEVLPSHDQYVQHLHHVLRSLCANNMTLEAIADNELFTSAIEQLYKALYDEAGPSCEATLTRIIERSRRNIERHLVSLTGDRSGCELTRTKLERIERDLQRHASHVLAKTARLVAPPAQLYSTHSESSIYTLARSASFTDHRQSLREPGRWGGANKQVVNAKGVTHAASLVSADSSIYFSPCSHISADDSALVGGAARATTSSPLLTNNDSKFCETSI